MILWETQKIGERLSNISHAIQTNVYNNQTAFPLCASM